MKTRQAYWKNKKILLTGAAGFVGSRLLLRLLQEGAQVTAVTSKGYPSGKMFEARFGYPKKTLQGVSWAAGNLADSSFVKSLGSGFSHVFHLAASAIVLKAIGKPSETIYNNVIATLNILELAREGKAGSVLVASSDKAYGDHKDDKIEPLPYKENYALRGLDIYSSSKACGDILSQAYAFQYGIPILILRCGNIYGPGDMNFTRLIPKTIMLLLNGLPPEIKQGHERILREYMFIDDLVNAYLLMGTKVKSYYGDFAGHMPKSGKDIYGWPAFNVGVYSKKALSRLSDCRNIQSVSSVISILQKKVANIRAVKVVSPRRHVEIPDEFFDSQKLMSLGFKGNFEFDEGLDESIAWYKQNFKILNPVFRKTLKDAI